MKQVVQSYRSGELAIVDLPVPLPRAGQVLVRSRASLVSAGTEKYMLDLARRSLLGKALARPDWVRQVVDKARSDGVLEAYRQACARLDQPLPLGYSVSGEVVGVGTGVSGLSVGDRVACAGTGYASHAEYVSVPENLSVRLPAHVDFKSGAFVALGAIAVHAMRVAETQLGHRLAVIGLGLLGQLIAQIAAAAGASVVGTDPDPARRRLAVELGVEATAATADEFAALCAEWSRGAGVDAVLIAAHTESNGPIELAARVCRERARVVAVGTVGMQIPRKAFFEKELGLLISRAWGPGAFDPGFEERNVRYPLAYVRWTARENMEEFLRLVQRGRIRLTPIITHRFPIELAQEAYELVSGKRAEQFLGVLLTYGSEPERRGRIPLDRGCRTLAATSEGEVRISLIGGGLYARGTLLPAMKQLPGVLYRGIATARGLTGRHLGERFGFAYCAADYREILADAETDLVMILTRHDSHARLMAEALEAGKHVFVEKPLAVDRDQLRRALRAYEAFGANRQRVVMVGFNRRFSPLAQWIKEQFADTREPLAVHCTVNAGRVPGDHWVT